MINILFLTITHSGAQKSAKIKCSEIRDSFLPLKNKTRTFHKNAKPVFNTIKGFANVANTENVK